MARCLPDKGNNVNIANTLPTVAHLTVVLVRASSSSPGTVSVMLRCRIGINLSYEQIVLHSKFTEATVLSSINSKINNMKLVILIEVLDDFVMHESGESHVV